MSDYDFCAHNGKNIVALPTLSKRVVEYEALEAELAMANKRIEQANARRNSIIDKMIPLAEAAEVERLRNRGIFIGKTKVVVVPARDGLEIDHWQKKTVFVMGVDADVKHRWVDWDLEVKVGYDLALVKKDGTPSKASTGIYGPVEIIRLATESDI